MSWDGSYPVRAKILDVVGQTLSGYQMLTPEVSKPYIGRIGLAEEIPEKSYFPDIRITFDDGTVLWGYECWWEPMEDEEKELPTEE